jgi:hypothetical protein
MLHNIGVEQLVIGFQALVIVFLVGLLLFEQLRRSNAPREPRPPSHNTG